MSQRIALEYEPSRILLIKPSSLGDVVHALPVLKLLRQRFAAARIDWLLAPAWAPLLRGHPLLDGVLLFERHELARAWRSVRGLMLARRFLGELRAAGYDLVVDLQGLFRSGLIAALSGSPRRVGGGDAREGARWFYTDEVHGPTGGVHAVDRYLRVARALGCEGEASFDLAIRDGERAAAARLVGEVGSYAVVIPGAHWLSKRWPVESFAALPGALRERFGLATVVCGAPSERALGEAVGGAVNLAGRTSVRELCAVIEGAALVVCNDSGPMHIAAALGRPLVSIFGPTDPARTGPWRRPRSVVRLDIQCSPCFKRRCSHQSCLVGIEVERVLARCAAELSGVG